VPNVYKTEVLRALQDRFGELYKVKGSESLFVIGQDAARIYIRYSKVHPGGRTFFGIRDVDLRKLEGFNSFFCFLLDDGSEPVFVPYADFEEIFRGAETASDGQYKVQLICSETGRELYIARRGRFNVEGYVGMETISRSLNTALLREANRLTHSQVQTLLAGIGNHKRYSVYVPERDICTLDWNLTDRFELRGNIPPRFEQVKGILSEIDVVWITRGGEAIEGLFEVEHSTTVYSGLLRFNDILLIDPKVARFSIVSNEVRRALFSRQLFRPTFKASGLADMTSFLEYSNVLDWHGRLSRASIQVDVRPSGTSED
jgi:hypothetical protein